MMAEEMPEVTVQAWGDSHKETPPFLQRTLPQGLEPLAELALDLSWTWIHDTDNLWDLMDPEIWRLTRNPWLVLQSVSQERLEELSRSSRYTDEIYRFLQAHWDGLHCPGWFRQTYPQQTLRPVAYFSMEFGLGGALPLYAGGLGILAGDYLKAASDLDVPVVGIGLLYQEGYFRQILDGHGWQVEAYPHNDPTGLPVRPVMDASGRWLRVPLELPGRTLRLRVWQVQVGRVRLYLLDSNDPLNSAADRGITSKLYDGRREIRLLQEMVLGIGGWRVLKALRIPVEVCHLNEGHAAFAVLERTRSLMHQIGQPFPTAWWAARAGNVFTTHTPVSAGFDTWRPDLIGRYLREYMRDLDLSLHELLALGRQDPQNLDEYFNMAILALRGSIVVNGVSQLHAAVSRQIFQPLFPRWPAHEVPVRSITNGVHVSSWQSEWADAVWTKAAGKARWLGTLENLPEAIQGLPDVELWTFRTKERHALVDAVRRHLAQQLRQYGADPPAVEAAQRVLDPNVLTLGFARRFVTYKRPNLLLRDPERLIGILTHPERPVQLVVAGKAHPQDEEGKRLVRQFVQFTRQPSVPHRAVFLEDYDMELAGYLVRGVDVWINTPKRPWEACGTSGMKVLVNGGLNLSELDGWWAEAYTPDVGWALGDGLEHPEADWDAVEAEQLYDLLEQHIAPEFYDRDTQGIPVRWVGRIRASMARLTPRFSANRMLREYVEQIYVPATAGFRDRIAEAARLARELVAWDRALEKSWPQLHFGKIQVQGEAGCWSVQVPVYLSGLDPAFVRVELYADPWEGQGTVCEPMVRGDPLPGAVNGFLYHVRVSATRPAEHFTLRILPMHPAAQVPLEASYIWWQR
jgi:glycogen phosphorylase